MSDDTVEVEINLPALGKGIEPSTGPMVVTRVQHMLNDLGFGPLVEDGDFGPKTESAVKTFEGNEGIETGGHVGPQVWPVLLTTWLLNAPGG